jgi:hypothetical protein
MGIFWDVFLFHWHGLVVALGGVLCIYWPLFSGMTLGMHGDMVWCCYLAVGVG